MSFCLNLPDRVNHFLVEFFGTLAAGKACIKYSFSLYNLCIQLFDECLQNEVVS